MKSHLFSSCSPSMRALLSTTLILALSCSQKPSAPPAEDAAADPAAPLEVVQPQGQPAHVKGRVMVKLAPATPGSASALLAGEKSSPDEAVLSGIRSVAGVKAVRRQFPGVAAPAAGAQQMLKAPGGEMVPKPDLTRWYRVDVDPGADVMAKVAELKKKPGVVLAEPALVRRPSVILGKDTDPNYDKQWHLQAANVPKAWKVLADLNLPAGGSPDVVVAVIDTGIDLDHPDLSANLWTNSDGTHGRDVISNTNLPADDHGHGTHVAGIIAAQANNKAGGVGVAYGVKIMAIKAAQYSGILTSPDIAEGIEFAVAHGADVINMSFGGYGKSRVEEDALAVAFGQAVLVAAAGNDGLANDVRCDLRARAMYPAAYNWVLGVMAMNFAPNAKGDLLAPFSNYDCIPGDTKEYELMAPGAAIWSALPSRQYAAWSGTSMAAPVVSGIAALVRTRYPDKSAYSSRFIMGQLAATGAYAQAYTPLRGPPVSFRTTDAEAAIVSLPTPSLAYVEHWLFDEPPAGSNRTPNGRVDAGDTVELALAIRNHWGKATDVNVTIEPWAVGAFGPDPYITMDVGTVNYGAVGSFSTDDNGLVLDPQGAVTGAAEPFRFTVDPSTPNEHVIPFRVTITARNGFDAGDSTVYTTTSRFELTVTNGQELPRIIASGTALTLDKGTLWVVPDAMLIEPGAVVTITEGARIQFYSTEALAPYARQPLASLTVRGSLHMVGTATDPVEVFLANGYRGRVVEIQKSDGGQVTLSYVSVENPSLRVDSIDHARFVGTGFLSAWEQINGEYSSFSHKHFVEAGTITRSSFVSVGSDHMQPPAEPNSAGLHLTSNMGLETSPPQARTLRECLFANAIISQAWSGEIPHVVTDNVFLANSRRSIGNPYDSNPWRRSIFYFSLLKGASQVATFERNAFLERYATLDPGRWVGFRYLANWRPFSELSPFLIANNFWGTASDAIIGASIVDYEDDFSLQSLVYQPVAVSAPDAAYPFVVDASASNGGGRATTVAAEPVTFTITFNRDMDPTVDPQVSFGPAEPYTDYTVTGAWQDARTWVGTYTITPVTGDGYQYIRVAGARAANDPWLVTGNDTGRFRFEIVTSGTESMNLQASGGEGTVDLSWTQNDFDLLAGYNVYRATTADGSYSRVNPAIIAPQTKSFQDTSVAPGQPYFYRFKVVKSDMTESQYSNVASATPVDTIAPVISHTPVTSGSPGLALSLSATITDNVAVQGATLFYRTAGTSGWTSLAMVNVSGSSYSATIPAIAMLAPGTEYYLSATDGRTPVTAGSAGNPYAIVIDDRPVVTSLSPTTGPASGGTEVTVSGSNFKAGATVSFGGVAATTVTVVSPSQITCVTPAHAPNVADVIVTNPDTRSGTKLRAFTFESDVVRLSLPALEPGQRDIVTVPVYVSGVDGLVAADLTVQFDAAVLTPRAVSAGSLTSDWNVLGNTTVAGQVRISMASGGAGAAGSGTIATVEFEVIGGPGTTTALTLSTASLNEGAIPVQTQAGSLAVGAVFGVSGTVTFWTSPYSPVTGVQLGLDGDRLYTAQTGAGGTFTVASAPPGSYTLRAAKSDDIGTAITATDASLVLRHAVGLTTLSGVALAAADVNKSGGVSSMDAHYILQVAAGLLDPPFPGAGVVWEFTPASRAVSISGAAVTGQDFTAYLIGDVTGSWTPPQAGLQVAALARGASLSGSAGVVRIAEGPPAADRTLTATVSLDSQGQDLSSMDVVLAYDPSLGNPVSVVPAPALAGWMVVSNTSRPGEIRVALASATAIRSSGAVLTITFALVGSAKDVALTATSVLVDEVRVLDIQYATDMGDARDVSHLTTSIDPPTPEQLALYDVGPVVNGVSVPDGEIDVEDLVVILRRALGVPL